MTISTLLKGKQLSVHFFSFVWGAVPFNILTLSSLGSILKNSAELFCRNHYLSEDALVSDGQVMFLSYGSLRTVTMFYIGCSS